MWKVLIPLVILVVVLLAQLQVAESFTTTSSTTTTTDASGNPTDASGNRTDASGNIAVAPTGSQNMISLTLADLLNLFRMSGTVGSTQPSRQTVPGSQIITQPTQLQNGDLYQQIRPQLLSEIRGVVKTEMDGAPYKPLDDGCSSDLPCSDSAAQGMEFQNALKDYIRKDEIPCYGCSL